MTGGRRSLASDPETASAAHVSHESPMEALNPDALVEELVPAEEALVRAAYRLIASKGIERTTLQDIADAAGVSKALAVYYFKTKENLMLAAIRWVLARVTERMTGVVDSVDAPEEKVQAMIDAIFVDPRRNRDFYLAYTALINEGARNERFAELNTTFQSIMNVAYADLIRAGEGTVFAVDGVDDAAMGVRALIDGYFLQWLEETNWIELHESYKQACARAILRYLGAVKPPPAGDSAWQEVR
jgi:TetR/AcrR family transcriptional regulator, fatty acid metabolism regulator protein